MMNIERLTNQELAAELEHWAGKADLNNAREYILTADELRVIAARLRLPTDDDLDAAVAAEREDILARVKVRVERRAVQLNAIISDLESLESELNNDGDPRHYESDVEDDE